MKEDLGMYKNQLNYAQTLQTAGHVLGEVPRYVLHVIPYPTDC